MKFLLISLAIFAAAVNAQHYGGQQSQSREVPNQATILHQTHEMQPDGPYQYAYENTDGTKKNEEGTLGQGGDENGPAINAQGGYSYVGDDGATYSLTYIANENGFQPVADYLPTPPPTPEAIARSLDFIRSHPQTEQEK
ncbi:hypothetical protein PV325_008047 [Microctonus aethiopoides]|uniref:Larval cuticle protein LCP-17 n=1 Tax=Microctonus aethiopoides TaxID=144406 RepID=A0AA39CB21_9HYME|nr:hypothetical protein PV326_005633 [Microctonus aethiopoides]KAK0089292.1 hypothetical protein PV325_008047 [Microctonus aethiopoides]KAK0160909.1 hypothetical protein PV328_008266 [Microctonus aethiopoides]